MKLIIRVVSVVLGFSVLSSVAADSRAAQLAELDALKAELKPLRQRAYLESDVIAAKKTLDDAYRAYWKAVRVAMLRLEPAKQDAIEKEAALREATSPGGSRAEHYEKKAAAAGSASPSPKPAKKKSDD